MKKIFNTSICLLLFSFLLNSCNDDDPFLTTEKNSSTEILNYKFTYNGMSYSAEYIVNSDETVTYKDETVEKLVNNLIDKDKYIIYVDRLNEITIYDDFGSYIAEHEISNKVGPTYPVINNGPEATIRIHKDHNLLGQSVTFIKPYGGSHISVPNLGSYGMNDEMTSFYARIPFGGDPTFKIVFYRDHNYLGASIIFNNWYTDNIWNEMSIMVSNLGSYQIPGSNRSWNDEVTSIKTIP